MTELLFIAITIFFIYVVFQVVGKQEEPESTQVESKPSEVESKPAKAAEAVKQVEAVATEPTVTPAKPASKPAGKRTTKASGSTKTKVAAVAAEPAAAPAAEASPAGDTIKNPKTGEVAKINANYSFAKRWIKDALVEEGLLDKVYKNNELDAATTAKIQDALQKLKAMAKYQ